MSSYVTSVKRLKQKATVTRNKKAADLALKSVVWRLQRKFAMSAAEAETVKDAMRAELLTRDGEEVRRVLVNGGFSAETAEKLAKSIHRDQPVDKRRRNTFS